MPLLQILLALIVVGFLLWLVNRFIPMEFAWGDEHTGRTSHVTFRWQAQT